MKTIIIKWVPEVSIYGKKMLVIMSGHERFVVGSRFDFGFFKIASDEGYTIISLPWTKEIEKWEIDHLEK